MIYQPATGTLDSVIHCRCCCDVFKSSLKALTRTSKQSCILEKEMATHSSTFARRIPWTVEPGRLWTQRVPCMGHKEWDTTKWLTLSLSFLCMKDGTDEPICRAAVETQTLRTDLWTWLVGEEGEGGMYGENMETYITICKIDSQWGFAVWLREFKPAG